MRCKVPDQSRDQFIEQIAAELKRPVRFDPRFDERVMEALNAPEVIPLHPDRRESTRRPWIVRPWTLRVEGEVRKPLEIDIDQLLKWFPLVDCSVSFGTNCGALLFCPGVQVPARPGPVKGMRKAAIVLRPTGIEVIDQLLP